MDEYFFSCPTDWRFTSDYNLFSMAVQCKPNNTFAAPDVWPTCANGKTICSLIARKCNFGNAPNDTGQGQQIC
jgi:hypothetical protein